MDWANADTETSDRLENKSYLLTTGMFAARDEADLAADLEQAAMHDFGHRGLLEIGREKVLAEAVEFAAGDTLYYSLTG